MPLIKSNYKPTFIFRQSDIITIYAAKFRRVIGVNQYRERLELKDGDFLDIDWSYAHSENDRAEACVILLHGLEGSAKQPYILGAAKLFNQNYIDACAVNYRCCSGELNRKFYCYHSGKTDDIQEVLDYVIHTKGYNKVIILGLSLGANITLKLLGESPNLPKEIKAAIAISAPCDLSSASNAIMKPRNYIYEKNFLFHLIKKLRAKQEQFPDKISIDKINQIKTLKDFDEVYTSVSHGFKNADDYYAKCSSLQFLPNIKIPTYILNAEDDSFIGESSYPYVEAEANPYLYLETPIHGGHVSFYLNNNTYYSEQSALAFALKHL